MGLVSELRRRNVFRMAVLYAVAAWLIMQVAEVVIALAELPGWSGQLVLALLAVGFPIALIFSWFYELTPEGVSLEKDVDLAESMTHVTGRRMDFIVISLLAAAVILFAYDKWWIGPPPEKSIAVLAFKNLSGDAEQEYFSDGISEEILNLLAKIRPLKVIARTSSFSFKNKEVDIATMAAQLNVRHILEGSVRRSGDRVRITAQLIDAADSTPVWSQSYDREVNDIFAVQDEIAAAISDALKVKLAVDVTSGEFAKLASVKTDSTEAYDAYLEGREVFRRRGSMQDAIDHLERALQLDSNYAPAHAQLALATTMLGIHERLTLEEARRIAIPLLDRADELEPNLAETHAGRALLGALENDFESEIRHARKALAVNPSYGDAMNWLYLGLIGVGHYEEAEVTLKQMLVIDPLTLIGRWNYIVWLSRQGRAEEAHRIADQLLVSEPTWASSVHAEASFLFGGNISEGLSWGLQTRPFSTYAVVAFVQVGEFSEARREYRSDRAPFIDLAEGRYDEAIQATQEYLRSYPDSEITIALASNALYRAGRLDEALPLLERLLEFIPEGRPLQYWGTGTSSWVQPQPLVRTMQLALSRRRAGNEEGAQAALKIVSADHAARRSAGFRNHQLYRAEAMVAAFEHDPDRAIAALKTAIDRGLRDRWFFDDPMFEDLNNEPRFIALREELDAILDAEYDKVLQLICFNNPVSDDWQPLPETCEGVVEQQP